MRWMPLLFISLFSSAAFAVNVHTANITSVGISDDLDYAQIEIDLPLDVTNHNCATQTYNRKKVRFRLIDSNGDGIAFGEALLSIGMTAAASKNPVRIVFEDNGPCSSGIVVMQRMFIDIN